MVQIHLHLHQYHKCLPRFLDGCEFEIGLVASELLVGGRLFELPI